MIRWKSQPLRRSGLAVAGLVSMGLVLTGAPFVARAQNSASVDKLIQMNKKALEDYDTLEWDTAKRTLLQALVFAKKANLESHPMMARTYVHLGAVYIAGFKDKQKGLQSFARALEIDPSIRIAKAMSTPELEDAFAEASKGGGGGGSSSSAAAPAESSSGGPGRVGGSRRKRPIMETDAAPPPPPKTEDDEDADPELPAHINALECPTKDETPLDKPVLVRCAVAPKLPVSSMILLYMEPGADEFTSVTMEKNPKGWYVGKIPKKAVTGTTLRFYIEGRDAKGKPIVLNGSSSSPNLMLIRSKEAAELEKELKGDSKGGEEEENPLDEPDPNRRRRFLGTIDKSKIGLDTRYGNRRFWIGLGLGTGFGYAKGNGFEARTEYNNAFIAGGAWAGFAHLAPEIGVHLTPNLAISLEGRNQYIYQEKRFARYAAGGAHSVLLRVLLYTKQSRARFYGAVAAGGGEGFRLILYPGELAGSSDAKERAFRDTVRGGPFLVGVGGGFLYEISKSVSWFAEVNALAGLPIFSVVADLNTGFQFNFGSTVPPVPQLGQEPVVKRPAAAPAKSSGGGAAKQMTDDE